MTKATRLIDSRTVTHEWSSCRQLGADGTGRAGQTGSHELTHGAPLLTAHACNGTKPATPAAAFYD